MSKKKAKHLGQTAAKQATAIAVTAPTAEPTVSQPTAEQSAQTANAAQNAQPTAVQNNTHPAPTEQSNAQLPSAAAEDLQDKIAELYSDELKRLYVFAARWQAALPTDDRSPESERRKALVAAIKEIISDNKKCNTLFIMKLYNTPGLSQIYFRRSPSPPSLKKSSYESASFFFAFYLSVRQ